MLEDKLYFKGVGGSEFQTYELDLELLKHINTKVLDIISLYLVLRYYFVQNSRYAVRPRVVEFRLVKEENAWWDRLLKEKVRQHWLRVDFQNWKDEEDVGDEKEPFEEVIIFKLLEEFKECVPFEFSYFLRFSSAIICGGAFQ